MSAKKESQGKPKLSLVSKESLIAEAKALEYGLQKYDKHNYKKGMDWSLLLDATLRHISEFNSGTDLDKESSLNHLWHAKSNLGMLIYMIENKVGKDDR